MHILLYSPSLCARTLDYRFVLVYIYHYSVRICTLLVVSITNPRCTVYRNCVSTKYIRYAVIVEQVHKLDTAARKNIRQKIIRIRLLRDYIFSSVQPRFQLAQHAIYMLADYIMPLVV